MTNIDKDPVHGELMGTYVIDYGKDGIIYSVHNHEILPSSLMVKLARAPLAGMLPNLSP